MQVRSRRARYTVALAWLLGAWLAATPWAAAKLAALRVDFIDVGQGDAALITSPTGKTVLIDGGPRESAEALTHYVRSRVAGPLDLVVLTHRHADHLGGLPAVVATVGARMYLDAPFPHQTLAYRTLMELLATKKIPVREGTRGRVIELGDGARLQLLTPPDPPLRGTRSDVNANSLVARLDYGTVSVLFAADAERPTERWLLETGARLTAQVLKVAHHGSHFSSTPAFLRAVGAEVAVISADGSNRYGHPQPATLRRLEATGARILRTDRDGSVTLWTDGRRFSLTTQRGLPALAVARLAWVP